MPRRARLAVPGIPWHFLNRRVTLGKSGRPVKDKTGKL